MRSSTGVTRRVFGTPAFFRLWLAQVVSATGDWLGLMAITALAAAVSRRAEGVAVGLVLGARVAPGFFLAPWAGVLVDRWDRKKVMITCDLARAAVMVVLPFVNSMRGLDRGLVGARGLHAVVVARQRGERARTSCPRATSRRRTRCRCVAAYGTFPLGAGLLIVFAKMAGWFADFSSLSAMHLDRLGLAFYFNALTFLVTALIVWRLPIHKAEREGSPTPTVAASTPGRRSAISKRVGTSSSSTRSCGRSTSGWRAASSVAACSSRSGRRSCVRCSVPATRATAR